MKFTMSRAVALNTFSQLLKTCNVKAKGKPDSEFLFQEKDGNLYATATNDKCQQTTRLDLIKFESDPGVKFSANGLSIVEYIKLFQDDEIACAYDAESDAFVMGSRLRESRFALPTPPSVDFVPMQFWPQSNKIVCEAPVITEALRCTAFSAATESRLSPKTAVRLSISNNKLIADSMDDYRLSRYTVITPDVNDKMEILIPRETAEILSHLLADTDEVSLQAGTSHVQCEWNNTVLIARLEANTSGMPYPDISQVFNLEEISKIKASRAEIQRALKIAGLVAKDSTIQLSSSTEGLTVASEEADTGASKHVVICDEQVGFADSLVAWKYMSKGVDMTVQPWIEISFVKLKNGHVAPILTDGDFSHVVLPVLPNQVKIAKDSEEEIELENGDEEAE